jgi:hypothetical protein
MVQRATHFLVILSAASVAAKWVLKEIELARRVTRVTRTILG